jgi:hypothetical protein
VHYYDSLASKQSWDEEITFKIAGLLRWLSDDSARTGRRIATKEWVCMRYTERCGVPQQTNECDCGVFMLSFVRAIVRCESFKYEQRDMPYVRRRFMVDLAQCNASLLAAPVPAAPAPVAATSTGTDTADSNSDAEVLTSEYGRQMLSLNAVPATNAGDGDDTAAGNIADSDSAVVSVESEGFRRPRPGCGKKSGRGRNKGGPGRK